MRHLVLFSVLLLTFAADPAAAQRAPSARLTVEEQACQAAIATPDAAGELRLAREARARALRTGDARGAACAAGYTDLSAFNRAFRAVTGRAPASGPGSPGARPTAVRASRDETADRPMQRESASHPAGVGSAHVR